MLTTLVLRNNKPLALKNASSRSGPGAMLAIVGEVIGTVGDSMTS
jgi:hypothetical protein